MQLTFPDCDILCLGKSPSSEEEDGLREWLEERAERRAVIFSESNDFEHPQVHFCSRDNRAIEEIAHTFVFLKFDYVAIEQEDEIFFSNVESIIERVFLNASDYRNRGVDRLYNLMKNSTHFRRALDASQLFGAFNHIPAIICGAGPSLEKEISYLRLLNERALIFAGGATLSSLSSFGIKPHFGGLIDPHAPSPIDFASSNDEIPCFFQNRVHPDKLARIQGPLLWTAGSEHDFFEESTFEGGWNVSTYLTALACHLGCNPIILVGVDLCGQEGKTYAGGLERKEAMIEVENVITKKDWLFAARFLSEFAKKHPEVHWINASDGVEFGGFEKKQLRQVALDSEYDLGGMIHAAIAKIKPSVMQEFDRDAIKESFNRVCQLCTHLIKHLEKTFPNLPRRDGEYTLLTIDLEREEAFYRFVQKIWDVWRPVFLRSISKDMPMEFGMELNKWLFIKGVCDDARQI